MPKEQVCAAGRSLGTIACSSRGGSQPPPGVRPGALAAQLDPLSLIIAADRGAILYFARRYDEAIDQFAAVLANQPGLGRARHILPAYALRGRTEEALANLAEWRKLEHGPWQPTWETHVYGRAGRGAEAKRAFREIAPAIGEIRLDPTRIYATAHLGLGENDKAMAWLERACREHSSTLMAIKVEPIFDPLRGDPRFAGLLRCAGFTP